MSRRESQKRETRRHIQGVAKQLFIERGYEKTTMRDLAREAGVGVGTIGLHFEDKKSLLLASFYEEIGEVTFQAMGSASREVGLRMQLKHILGRVYEYYATNTGYMRSVVKEALFIRGEWGDKFDAQIVEGLGLLTRLLEVAQERGEVKVEVDCCLVAQVFWSLYLQGLIAGFKLESFDPQTQVASVNHLCGVVLDGILEDGM